VLYVRAIAQPQVETVTHDSRDGHTPVFSIPENILLSSTTLQIILVNAIVHVYKPGNSRYNNNNKFYYIEHPLHIFSIGYEPREAIIESTEHLLEPLLPISNSRITKSSCQTNLRIPQAPTGWRC